MKKTVLLATSALFAVAMCGAASAAGLAVSSAGFNVKATGVFHSPKTAKTLYNQNSNNSGVGLVSQNFTSPTYSKASATDADDFIVPKGKKWSVGELDVTGVYFNGSGPAGSENITFYKNSSTMPGKAIKSGTFTDVKCTDSSGSFTCTLPKKVKLKAGTYWVGIAANMAFTKGGEWGWEGNTTINGNQANWENPGGYFGVCSTWGTNSSCLGYSQDDMFDLKS